MVLNNRTQNYVRDKLAQKRGRNVIILKLPDDSLPVPNQLELDSRLLDIEQITKSMAVFHQMILLLIGNHSVSAISALFDIPYGQLHTTVQKIRESISKKLANKGKKMTLQPENLTPLQISRLPIDDLMQLNNMVNKQLAEIKIMKEKIDDGLNLRFSETVKNNLLSENKDTGTTRFADGVFQIVAEVPKKVAWDTEKMEELVKRIPEERRKDIVKISYSIEERKYSALPTVYQELFHEARTITPGKIRFQINFAGDKK
jgi:hypothetical protein